MQNVSATLKGTGGVDFPRLFVIFARSAPTAVIFRRGPSEWVQLIRWNSAEDTFEFGQWFHGRIYERRCDLSPDGSLLIYFAQKINRRTLEDKEFTYAWTAVSKPPYLTAPALWPKGDCWAGGGSFENNGTIVLNHKPEKSTPHPNHKPKTLEVKLRPDVCGEDDPIYSERVERDGWRLKAAWEVEYLGYPDMYRTNQPEIRERSLPNGNLAIRLTRSISRLDYSELFDLSDQQQSILTPIVGASWVDWDQRGRLIIARQGKISVGELAGGGSIREQILIDLCGSKPAPTRSPKWAQSWYPSYSYAIAATLLAEPLAFTLAGAGRARAGRTAMTVSKCNRSAYRNSFSMLTWAILPLRRLLTEGWYSSSKSTNCA